MKQRLSTGWNFTRIIYLLIGGFVMISSAISREWMGVFLGGYVASMGLFALGCAAGNCFIPGDHTTTKNTGKEIESVEFEEIK